MSDGADVVRPLSVFFSFSHKDQDLRDKLQAHLSALERTGIVRSWHDRRIVPGTDWEGEIDKHLDEADIILLLVSADFLASNYCYEREMRRALERHEAGEAHVIPIILRPVDYGGTPVAKLQALPPGGFPVTAASWENTDAALEQVARGVRQVIDSTLTKRVSDFRSATGANAILQTRRLDGAIAREIPIGESREVVAMIRLERSDGLRLIFDEDAKRGKRAKQFTAEGADVRSTLFTVEFPLSESGVLRTPRMELKVRAPDFEPREHSKAVIIPSLRDSQHHSFLVRANREGEHVLNVELWCDDLEVVGQLLRTQAAHHGGPKDKPPSGTPAMLIATVPLKVMCVAMAATAGGISPSKD
jgi:hypothetical protein